MAVQKYVSEIKHIYHNQQAVYDYLSNFENLAQYMNSEMLGKITDQIPQIKISNFESDRDSCSFNITGIGNAELRIINREPIKTIKFESSEGLPLNLTLWIQLLPAGDDETRMRLTLHAGLSKMIQLMVGSKLQDGINSLAGTLASLPYS